MKLYATLETGRGKTVSIADNEQITATVYDGNRKSYSVTIEWLNMGDPEQPAYGAIISTRDWRNVSENRRKAKRTA